MIKEKLRAIYKDEDVISFVSNEIAERLNDYQIETIKPRKAKWDEEDIFLITYADQFNENASGGDVKSFKLFFDKYLKETISVIHFLPFYPYSSDDGFSVIDFYKINPKVGDWQDIHEIGQSARLMFDFVCNHMSVESPWFKSFLNDEPTHQNFFIEQDPTMDLSQIVRPRTSPLITPIVDSKGETRHIWTTFSADQVDLNFKEPKLLLAMIDVLLFYLKMDAEYIRLDAVGYMWKELGTSSIHLPETHKIIQLFREIVEKVAPGTILITETNVPHIDNISYFGNGENEAQMVYQFPLPPLVLHAIKNQNANYLTSWANTLTLPSENTTYFNFLASHDGIGMNPIRGIIPEDEILALVDNLKENGALVSYKQNPDGSMSPYEINVTYMDALSEKETDDQVRIQRFLVAHSILLTIIGVPAIYIQSIIGSRNDYQGVKATGSNRSINRQKYQREEIEHALETDKLRKDTYQSLSSMLAIRKSTDSFSPESTMAVLTLGEEILAYRRKGKKDEVLVIQNVSKRSVDVKLPAGQYQELLSETMIQGEQLLEMEPYGYKWFKKI